MTEQQATLGIKPAPPLGRRPSIEPIELGLVSIANRDDFRDPSIFPREKLQIYFPSESLSVRPLLQKVVEMYNSTFPEKSKVQSYLKMDEYQAVKNAADLVLGAAILSGHSLKDLLAQLVLDLELETKTPIFCKEFDLGNSTSYDIRESQHLRDYRAQISKEMSEKK